MTSASPSFGHRDSGGTVADLHPCDLRKLVGLGMRAQGELMPAAVIGHRAQIPVQNLRIDQKRRSLDLINFSLRPLRSIYTIAEPEFTSILPCLHTE